MSGSIWLSKLYLAFYVAFIRRSIWHTHVLTFNLALCLLFYLALYILVYLSLYLAFGIWSSGYLASGIDILTFDVAHFEILSADIWWFPGRPRSNYVQLLSVAACSVASLSTCWQKILDEKRRRIGIGSREMKEREEERERSEKKWQERERGKENRKKTRVNKKEERRRRRRRKLRLKKRDKRNLNKILNKLDKFIF